MEGNVALAYYQQASKAAIDPEAWTITSSNSNSWAAYTVALRNPNIPVTQTTGIALTGTLGIAGDLEIVGPTSGGWLPPKAKKARRPRVYRLPYADDLDEPEEIPVVEVVEAPDLTPDPLPEVPRVLVASKPASRPLLSEFDLQQIRARMPKPVDDEDDEDDELALLLLMLY
jgi:hypothetical protein